MSTWSEWADTQTTAIHDAGQWRAPRDFDARGPNGALADGGEVVSFASNDYLGLTQHPLVVAAAHAALDRWGTGSGSARLIVGSRPVHHDLEVALAAWKCTDAAAIFPTGYQTNLGVLSTFGGPDTIIFSDELNHASIIDGARFARASVCVYRHNDLDELERRLATSPAARSIVVSDTIYSMDGDAAPLAALVDLSARYDALLVIDEAHAVFGPDLTGPTPAHVIRVGTQSKTLGSLGGFAAGPQPFIDLLVNQARSYIFTTASTPADAAAALAAIAIVSGPEGAERRQRLRAHVDRLAPGHPSPIVPIICGSEARAVDAAARLLDRGLLVPAIRPPTVAVGSSRLRITFSAAHTADQVTRLVDALTELELA
jgi:8-amino-7-oxononanoate synthase